MSWQSILKRVTKVPRKWDKYQFDTDKKRKDKKRQERGEEYPKDSLKERQVSSEGHIEGVVNRKSPFAMPEDKYVLMEGKDFSGDIFYGVQVPAQNTKNTKYTAMKYPPKLDSKGRPIQQKYTVQEERDSRKTGRRGAGTKYRKPVAAGQNKVDKEGNPVYVLDKTKKLTLDEESGNKFTFKEGKKIKSIRLKNLSFIKSKFNNAIFKFYDKKGRTLKNSKGEEITRTVPQKGVAGGKEEPIKFRGEIYRCNFRQATFDGAVFSKVVFKECNFRSVDLTKAKTIRDVTMIKCNVRGANIPSTVRLIDPINKDKMVQGKRK